VLPASPDGRDLAPRLAAELELPLYAGAVRVTPHHVVLAREGGLQMHTLVPPDAFVATLQPGVRGTEPFEADDAEAGAVHVLQVDIEASAGRGAAADPTVERVLAPDASTMDLAEAKRIVSGGAGLDSAEQFERLARIGAALGASVGATRVITDRGWIDHERQIGTTGVVVQPDLYLAFGVSGAVQHTSGLGHPHHIVSVNTDPHCPMMQLADLAVVADANAVLAELVALLGVDVEGARG
jgi:electron transfer flavoprotein alpha subunit